VRWPYFQQGLQTTVLNNASAYAYSVTITATFAAAQRVLDSPSLPELFLFVTGATAAFAAVEGAATRGFRDRGRPERGDVIALGSAIAMISVSVSLAVAIGLAHLLGGAVAWFVAPFGATVTFLLLSGLEMMLARREQERRSDTPEQEGEAREEAAS
jgi:hypothetical protein